MIFEDSDDQLEYIKKKMYENIGTTKYLNFFLGVDSNIIDKYNEIVERYKTDE